MDRIDMTVSVLDNILNSKRKRHIAGGILLSVSLLFGGLAFTALSIGTEDEDSELRLKCFLFIFSWSRIRRDNRMAFCKD